MFNNLITPTRLWDHLAKSGWILFDCRFDLANPEAGLKAYRAGHIPGAQYAHLEKNLSSPVTPDSGRHPLPDPQALAAQLGKWGVGPGIQVVCYDDQGGAFAARMWWLLRWLGHQPVAVLDGGWKRWIEAGHPVSDQTPRPESVQFTPQLRPDSSLTTTQVEQLLRDKGLLLMDARAENRFRGEVEPIDPVAGHIPGAINIPFTENLDSKGNFLPPEQLHTRYRDALGGLSPDKTAAMCGSGVTACHTLLAMDIAGLTGGRLYAGSWSEWVRDSGRAIATGKETPLNQ